MREAKPQGTEEMLWKTAASPLSLCARLKGEGVGGSGRCSGGRKQRGALSAAAYKAGWRDTLFHGGRSTREAWQVQVAEPPG